MKIVCISDTHCKLRKINVPEGDLLLHAGDLTFRGTVQEISSELKELGRIAKNFKMTCLSPGNHDWLSEKQPTLFKQMCEDVGVTYLHDSSVMFEDKLIYGSGWTPEFCNWALNLPRGQALKEKWDLIPDETQILITHGPPFGILDIVEHSIHNGHVQEHVGCKDLYSRIQQLKDLRLSVFGHLHFCGGISVKISDINFINASVCTELYEPTNFPVILTI